MASLYRKPIIVKDPATGKRVKAQAKKWWGRYRESDGRERRVPLASDKKAAQAMLNRLVTKAELRAAGLTDPYEEHSTRPLSAHVKDFIRYLRNRANTEGYIAQTEQRINKAIETCGFSKVSDFSASRFQAFLGDLRRGGMSIGSCNHYLRAFKMFNRWLVRDYRTENNPVAFLSISNPESDRKRVRRPLSTEEFALLLETAARAKPVQCISGEDRVLLYILACYTGFRRNEISSLTRQSLDLSRDPPTLTVQAACSKRRRVDVLPLRKDVTELLKHWLDKHPNLAPDEPLLNIRNRYTAKMLRKDLQQARKTWIEAAKAPAEKQAREQSSFLRYVDDCGRVADFHALRKTFITNLCLAGVSPKAAQTLARHSDINLTMNVYTLLTVHDQASAVEALPPVPGRKK